MMDNFFALQKWASLIMYRDPLFLRTFEADEESVEAVRVLVRLDHDPVLADTPDSIRLWITSPRKAQHKF